MDEHTYVAPVRAPDQALAPQVEEHHPQAWLEQAFLAHWERRYAEADVLYQRALALDAGLLSGWIWSAILSAQTGQPGKAEEQLKAALTLDPSLAAEQLDAARRREPDDGVLGLAGLLEIYHDNLDLAHKWLGFALRLNPDNLCALAWLARLQVAQGRIEEAASLFRRAVQLQPRDPAIHRTYARLLASSGHYPEAIEQLDAAIALNADDVETAQVREEVRKALERQRELDQWLKAGRQALQANQWETALQQADRVLAQAPESAEAQALKSEANAVRVKEYVRQSLAEAERLITKEEYTSAAALLDEAQQLLPADEGIRERLEMVKEAQRTQRLIARYLQDAQQRDLEGKSEEALQLLEQARQLNPESIALHQVYQELEKHNKARKLLSQALELAQKDPVSALELVAQVREWAPAFQDVHVVEDQIRIQARESAGREQVAEDRAALPVQDGAAVPCPNCGNPVRAQARFCGFCRMPLRCVSCAALLRPNALFCSQCGKSVQ
jgi:tetratricopeptide (TPR) repeat protein